MIRRMFFGLFVSVLAVVVLLFCLGFRPAQVCRLFAHPVTGGAAAELETPPPAADTDAPGAVFGPANFAVLGIYLAAMLAIGYAASRRIKGTNGFFVADGRLNYAVVGLSILGTYLSALTMMALPGMSYGAHDWTYMVQLPFLVITAAVVTRWILPQYRASGAISVYGFLEQRLGTTARLIGAVSFVIFAIGRMGLVLYLPALAFSTATGAPLAASIVAMGVIITLYTIMGGMEAVVWTDAIQVVIFVVAALLSLGFIFADVGVDRFIATGQAYGKFRVFIPGADIMKITSLWLVMETVFQTIRIYGTQQDITQRYLTTGSTEKANRSVWISILAYIPLGFIFYLMGTALFVFFKCHPEFAVPGKNDSVYPFFVVNHLPPGVAGLIIAAIFAAAMSSIDSCMNSASTVCVEDFVKRFARRDRPDGAYLRLARWLTGVWGALAVGLGLLFMRVGYALQVWGKLMGISTNGILGLMALAFLPIRVRWWAVVGGILMAYYYLFGMMYLEVNYLVWPVVGNTVCFVMALLLNCLGSQGKPHATGAGT
jgi:solute:Na+ symporter, SSS family